MRPAQLTPENSGMLRPAIDLHLRFNEAGAINAGKLHRRRQARTSAWRASMRPAQLTPENLSGAGRLLKGQISFNEAGAINAGKPSNRGG